MSESNKVVSFYFWHDEFMIEQRRGNCSVNRIEVPLDEIPALVADFQEALADGAEGLELEAEAKKRLALTLSRLAAEMGSQVPMEKPKKRKEGGAS